MVLTPTYYVFDLFQRSPGCHPGRQLAGGRRNRPADIRVPQLSQSASVDDDGILHITLVNLSASDSCLVRASLEGMEEIGTVSAQVLSGAIQGKNDFDAPQLIQPTPLKNIDLGKDCFRSGASRLQCCRCNRPLNKMSDRTQFTGRTKDFIRT